MNATTIERIKTRWPLAVMLEKCGIPVPPRGKFSSPFRADEHPSCEVFKETVKDWGTGESYDCIGVFAAHKNISNSEAIKQLAAELPGRQQTRQDIVKTPPPASKPARPPTHYSIIEAEMVASLRGLSVEGVDFAGFLGTLSFGNVCGFHCWILSDSNEKIIEARRVDGEKFPSIGNLGERKSHTLKGSSKSWPLGMNPPGAKVPVGLPVWIVEGGPDYLAACDILTQSAREFLPVTMLGASQSIHAEALSFFRGRDVLILAHPDAAGINAAQRWGGQLKSAGARPRLVQLQGGDLNDLVREHGAKVMETLLNKKS